jgi:hypothetical protein
MPRIPQIKGHRMTLDNGTVLTDGFYAAGTSWSALCECGWSKDYITSKRWAQKFHREHRLDVLNTEAQ